MQLLQVLQLFRWVNQGFIILTLCLLQYCLIHPLFPFMGMTPSLDTFHFILLVVSVVFIAGAGYVINDYFDIAADQINKPEKVKIGLGKPISKTFAMRSYIAFNVMGIVLSFYVAWKVGNYKLGYIHVFVAAMLWFYATTLKGKLLIGNFLVSFVIALCVSLVIFYDQNLLQLLLYQTKEGLQSFIEGLTGFEVSSTNEAPANVEATRFIVSIIAAFVVFAFLLNFIREIVKDIQDIDGDKVAGYRTLPIVTSVGFAKLVAAGLSLLCLNFVIKVLVDELLLKQYVSAIGGTILVALPLIAIVGLLWRAVQIPKDFKLISQLTKGVMLAGLLYLPYFASTIQEPTEPVLSLEDMGIESFQIDTIYDEPAAMDTNFIEVTDSTAMEYIEGTEEGEILEFEIDKDSIPSNIMDLLKNRKQ
ncbi:MAG: geranylgeranylglycerol-phosphate geranylgeranyltransferase [Chitinophagales bacterium]